MQPSSCSDVFSLKGNKPSESIVIIIKECVNSIFKFPPPPDPPDMFDLLERGMLISG